MKIIVQSKDGKQKVLDLRGTWMMLEAKHFNRMRALDGAEYFFDKDGFYDG